MQPMALESIPAYSGFRGGQIGRAYNEAAFRHFLAIERSRAERSRRPLFLALVTVRQGSGAHAKLPDDTAAALFRGLSECVREVDFVGWYKEGYAVGAVLAQAAKASAEVPPVIAQRLLAVLTKRVAADQSGNLRVRVVRLGGRVRT